MPTPALGKLRLNYYTHITNGETEAVIDKQIIATKRVQEFRTEPQIPCMFPAALYRKNRLGSNISTALAY